jgi:hypothetical protein
LCCAQTGEVYSVDVRIDGDGDPEVLFWTRRPEDVIREIMADTRFDGHQALGFELYTNENGDRVFGESNGSLSFQMHAAEIGPDTVPVSIVLYVDGTWQKTHLTTRCIYSKCTRHFAMIGTKHESDRCDGEQ